MLENTSAIVLMQIRAFDSPRDISTAEQNQGTPHPPPSPLAQRVATGFHWLTTPLRAVLQARSAGMSFRNDEQTAALAQWFREPRHEANRPDFFQTVSFDCDATASLNWYITQLEHGAIVRCLAPQSRNWQRLMALQAWWNNEQPQQSADTPLTRELETAPSGRQAAASQRVSSKPRPGSTVGS